MSEIWSAPESARRGLLLASVTQSTPTEPARLKRRMLNKEN
jgi:hypothetical protein